ncbi:MAG: hypothetical protein QNJ30_20660 [Kiloniellales bacterium]|nr:hypothetical protein [Kiloniellales bacterium]
MIGYELAGDPPDGLAAVVGEHLRLVEQACAPMAEHKIMLLLGRVRVMTQGRLTDAQDLVAQSKFYARELRKWPADVVEYVLRTQPSASKWWPAWQELEEQLALHGKRRLLLRDALRRLLARCSLGGG